MFSKATSSLVHQIDPEGSLIPVSRVNDSDRLVLMALVVKRKQIWFWQKPKYRPTDFTLSDLLLGDTVLTPGVSETEFLTYNGTIGDKYQGKLKTEGGPVDFTFDRMFLSKLNSSFGQLKKEQLNVKKLHDDSSDKLVDMQHSLVRQLEKHANVLAVVKERILTTTSCSVTQTTNVSCTFQGVFKMLGSAGRSVEVNATDDTNIQPDNDISLEIPPGTPIAYSVLELEVKKDGHFAICLQHDTIGGFEEDSVLPPSASSECLDVVDGKLNGNGVQEKVPVSALLNGSEDMDLSALADLPPSPRCAFRKQLQKTLNDRSALTVLQCALEELCSGNSLNLTDLSESQRKSVSDVLDTLNSDKRGENGHCDIPPHLNAAHLLVSALEELPDETLGLLAESSPAFLEAFDTLMCRLKQGSEPLSIQTLPAFLKENPSFQRAEQLLGSIRVTLRRDGDRLWTETHGHAGVLPLVLSLGTHGLASLCRGSE